MKTNGSARVLASLINCLLHRRMNKTLARARMAKRLVLTCGALLVVAGLSLGVLRTTGAVTLRSNKPRSVTARVKTREAKATTQDAPVGKNYYPEMRKVMSFAPVNVRELATQESLEPENPSAAELKSIDPPKGEPPSHGTSRIVIPPEDREPSAVVPSATGISPGPTTTFKANESLVAVIPPDTDGAVGTTHIVSASNDRIRIFDRNGTILSTVTTNSFWSGLVLEGGATPSITDPRVRYDRFNNRFIFAIVANPQTLSSATLIAVTATNDPTGTWFRYAIDADPTATAAGGMWADFPSIGFNKDWIVIQNNLFGFGTSGTGYLGPQIYAIDKANIYTGPVSLGAVPTFFEAVATGCVGPVFETQLGCGFTMSPSVTEDNTTANVYLVEDWDTTAAQLRVSKITGPVAAPVLTVGTQIPQSLSSWRFNATRIQTSGGYLPQHQQSAHLVSGARMMANDSRMQNVVYRGGSLWCVHHVMIATTPTAPGVQVGGGGANPADNHTAIQWWQIDPSIEALQDPITGLGTTPTQRGRIEDPTADNCHNGANGLVATPPCSGSTANQHGTFFVFPSIAVNSANDVLIGFSQFGALHYGSAGYAYRSHTDALNTTRDPVVYRPGESNDNLGGGSGAARQDRWGDYSMSQTDPLNDTDFWTVQEYTGVYRDIGLGTPVCPWETWWALVKPSTPAPSTTGNLIISEFRLRGPQGVRDEFVELYNPGTTPLFVSTTDNSDGWTLAYSTTAGVISGVAVIPNGTVIPAKGHFLIANDPASSDANGLPTTVYSLTTYPNTSLRTSESDTGWAGFDLADNGGFAIFKSATPANWTAPNRMDSVGFVSTPAGLFKEGTGIPDVSAAGLQETIFRKLSSGFPQDTDNNATDFVFADVAGTLTTAGQRLGAPGPENLNSPIHNTTGILGNQAIDPGVGAGAAPNYVIDPTADPGNNSTFGTLTIRRTYSNLTGSPITRLRFRVVDMTTFPPSGSLADLRVRTSTGGTVAISGTNAACPAHSCSMQATTLETPPAQALGGGLNSSVSAGTITLAAPLVNGGTLNVNFLLGIQTTGCGTFVVIAEADTGVSSIFGANVNVGGRCAVPTAAPATISGHVTKSDGSALAGVAIRLGGSQQAVTITDASGNYRFDDMATDQLYTVTPQLANYHFAPANLSFSLLGNKTNATFTGDADAIVSANAIDTTEFFVRQQYLDFLGREPDGPGFTAWVSELNNCAAGSSACDRAHVSEMFFRSPEFQQRGYYIYRFYSTALGRKPDFAEFTPDMTRVSGFLTNEQLEAAKMQFAIDFTTRPAFVAKYAELSNAAYVDALASTAQVNISNRQTIIDALNNGAIDRAHALRIIAESGEIYQKYYNQAFVVMEYFGYMRRDPDALYQQWIDTLNQTGDARHMVEGFVDSVEYRNRFRR